MAQGQQQNHAGLKICIGECCFTGGAVKEAAVTDELQGSHQLKSATAVVIPHLGARWDYHAESKVTLNGKLHLAGPCLGAELKPNDTIALSLHDHSWEFNHAVIRNLELFGMEREEAMYWLPQLTQLLRGVTIPGLVLDTQLRPFLYAVPLSGITALRDPKSFLVNDFGVAAGDRDTTFAPLLAKLNIGTTEAAWRPDVPKAYGLVFATNLMQAERRALDRAQFTADQISFALRAGMSHLEDRKGARLLPWNGEQARTEVSLRPWVLIREVKSVKGWIRSVPLIDTRTQTDIGDSLQRIQIFAEHFLDASAVGDVKDQKGYRELTERERRLATGIQRSLRWLGIASRETQASDQFVASWVALEAILDAVEYPGLFSGNRAACRAVLQQKISETELPAAADALLGISIEMLKGRLLQNEWPLRRKLEIFARAIGVRLLPGDGPLISRLGRVRGKVLHTGRDDSEVSEEQLRGLQYLVERLLAAASFGAYRDLEDGLRHQIKLGQVGAEGGAAPMTLDGRDVPYSLTLSNGGVEWECIVEAKIYDSRNSELMFGN